MTSSLRSLVRFAVEPDDEGGYLLSLEDAVGGIARFSVGEEQLDVLADLIDDALASGRE